VVLIQCRIHSLCELHQLATLSWGSQNLD
jgi:hypothetical protein